ncbi:hypothetical protein G7046_g3060 [Stylonectria norvegica]|nr:hypothetical protein G7046_g3060 [Stylonectria norvegica]
MAPTRYDGGEVSLEPLAQELVFQPSGKVAKNRLMKSAMAESLATWSPTVLEERGIPTDQTIELYRNWGAGKNSWGIILTGNIDTAYDALDGIGDMIVAPTDEPEGKRFEKFQELASVAKANGSLVVAQITHPGRQCQSKINKVVVSASDVQLEPKMGQSFGKPHAASKEEIVQIVEGFAHAAEYLYKAGFDGVELHAAHGYLISQFLSRTTNKRTDEYGPQSIENRLRFISDIAKAIRARVPADFIVASKLNSVEFQDGGVTAEEAKEVVERLENLGFDFVELSGGTYEDFGMEYKKESTKKREGFFLEFAQNITNSLGPDRKIRAYIVGGLRSVRAIVKALDVVDGVSLGRPAAAEPRLANDILEGRVTGAIKPVEMIEADFLTGMLVAQTQIAQSSRGKEPLNFNDDEVMKTFAENMGEWFQKVIADGDKMEFVRASSTKELNFHMEPSLPTDGRFSSVQYLDFDD